MYKSITLCILLAFSSAAFSQVNIIPKPKETILPDVSGSFSITAQTKFVLKDPSLQPSVNFFNDYLFKIYGFRLKSAKVATKNTIVLDRNKEADTLQGSYTLNVKASGIKIVSHSRQGVFYGIQSLLQLLPTSKSAKLDIPWVSIKDEPRFAYRGMHLDVGRHFFTVSEVKKYIDYLALHKMNYFHWHLTEDQGWRIEIKKYPRLTSVGGFRNGTITGHAPGTGNDQTPTGGFYTQEEVKDIVAYAARRYITTIPEIEMPGHASAAIAAYPELSCFPEESTYIKPGVVWAGSTSGKQVQQTFGVFTDVFAPTEKTFAFLQDVLDEVLPLFPSKFIHIGGDESPKDNWKRSEFCQQLIKEKGLKDEHGLQSYFIQRMEKYINSKGKQIIGWDEILEGGLAPNATVMSWRGEVGGIEAAKQKHNVIMTPSTYVYFDYAQSKPEDSLTIGGYLPVQTVYGYDPIPKELAVDEQKYVLGGQANLWTEYITNMPKLEYMIFPRMSALSEVLWSPKEGRSWTEFEPRLKQQVQRYDLWKVNYSKAYLLPVVPVPTKTN
ncbi:MAG: beta-N-acetylhexosaminidase [Pedobacter sp.]|jgi:hexosaminidase|nr:beta-N-acetylhexosaminidase [Pedobacter sp.]